MMTNTRKPICSLLAVILPALGLLVGYLTHNRGQLSILNVELAIGNKPDE